MKEKNRIKALIALNAIYIKNLAQLMTQKSGKKYTEDSLGAKLRRGTLTFNEVELIADILGYKVEFIQK